jgi:GntR family transcriptional regulator
MHTDTLHSEGRAPAVHPPQASSPSHIVPVLDRASVVSLYAQLVERIRELIDAGTWTATSRIPSERELCLMFHVSRITVRQALQILVREGRLVRASGRGTYVAAQVSCVMVGTNHTAALGHLLQHGTHPGGWQFRPSHSSAPAHVLAALGVEDGVTLTCLSRWRQPDVQETVYLSNNRCPGFRTYYHNDVPLYETLARYYGIVPDRATLLWYAPYASNAISETGSPGHPELVLRIRQTTFARDGQAFEHVEIHSLPKVGGGRRYASDGEGRSS